MNDPLNFDTDLNEREAKTLAAIKAKVIADLTARGIHLADESALHDIPSLRVGVVTGEVDFGEIAKEVGRLPEVQHHDQQREEARQFKAGEGALFETVSAMNPGRRMNWARHKEAKEKEAARHLTSAEENDRLRLVLETPPGRQRLDLARQLGVA